MTFARLLALASWLAIAAGSFQPFYLKTLTLELKTLTLDAAQLRATWIELPYRRVPGLRKGLVEIARRTPPDARILFWTPHRSWDGGYNYAYRRAQYLLAGREVLSLLADGRDVVDPRGVRDAQYIACWPECPPAPPGFAIAWKGDGGMLLRRAP